MADSSTVPFRVAPVAVTFVAGSVVGATTAAAVSTVAINIRMASIEHRGYREDAVLVPDAVLPFERRLGAFPLGDGRAELRVWARAPASCRCASAGTTARSTTSATASTRPSWRRCPGADYAYVVDGVEMPDPCSRWQPDGLRGPSRLLDPGAFEWTDDGWEPPALRDLVLYELHVGTFTPEGTFEAAIPHLPELRELGITAIELMPVAEFPAAAAGATTGCTCRPRSPPTAARRGSSGSSTPPTPPAWP